MRVVNLTPTLLKPLSLSEVLLEGLPLSVYHLEALVGSLRLPKGRSGLVHRDAGTPLDREAHRGLCELVTVRINESGDSGKGYPLSNRFETALINDFRSFIFRGEPDKLQDGVEGPFHTWLYLRAWLRAHEGVVGFNNHARTCIFPPSGTGSLPNEGFPWRLNLNRVDLETGEVLFQFRGAKSGAWLRGLRPIRIGLAELGASRYRGDWVIGDAGVEAQKLAQFFNGGGDVTCE